MADSDRREEIEFLEASFPVFVRKIRLLLVCMIVLAAFMIFVAQPSVYPDALENRTTFALNLVFMAILILALAVSFVRGITHHMGLVIGSLSLLLSSTMVAMVSAYQGERRAYAVGLIFVMLTANSLLPYRYYYRGVVNFAVVIVFCMLAKNDGVYSPAALSQIALHLMICAGMGTGFGWAIEQVFRSQWRLRHALEQEQRRSESLLLNVLPKAVADRLKNGDEDIVDTYPEVTVIFADIVGFTPLAERVSPVEAVKILNAVFSRFDRIGTHLGIEKIKTIGDAYMAVAGLPEPRADHAVVAATMALEMRDIMERLRVMEVHDLQLRIGLHTGPVAAGIIGSKKFLYDLWGDTVNVASRMESQGINGGIQMTDATRQALGDAYLVKERGMVEIKGRGSMRTWLLEGPKFGSLVSF